MNKLWNLFHHPRAGTILLRTTLALLRTHGLDVAAWPVAVRARLGLPQVGL